MSVGRLKKNLSITPASTRPCHVASRTAAKSTCQTIIGMLRLVEVAFITLQNLLPQIRPDHSVQFGESLVRFDIHQVSRAWEGHVMFGNNAAGGAGREHHDLVGQRYRLFKVM